MEKEGKFKGINGTKLSYRMAGKGKMTLFCFNGIGVAKWVFGPLEDYFADRYKIVTWDYPGHGLSETPKNVTNASFLDLAEDALLLAKHLKINKAYLLGHSAGFQVALELCRLKPSLAKGLISCLGTPGKTLETFMDSFWGTVIFDVGYIINAVMPDMADWFNANLINSPLTYHIGAALKLVNPAIAAKEEIERYLDHLTHLDATLFNNYVATGSKINSDDVLPKVKVPTLLIAAEYDRFVPMRVTKKMKKLAHKPQLFIIKNGTHAALLEQPDIFNLCIEKFLCNSYSIT